MITPWEPHHVLNLKGFSALESVELIHSNSFCNYEVTSPLGWSLSCRIQPEGLREHLSVVKVGALSGIVLACLGNTWMLSRWARRHDSPQAWVSSPVLVRDNSTDVQANSTSQTLKHRARCKLWALPEWPHYQNKFWRTTGKQTVSQTLEFPVGGLFLYSATCSWMVFLGSFVLSVTWPSRNPALVYNHS